MIYSLKVGFSGLKYIFQKKNPILHMVIYAATEGGQISH